METKKKKLLMSGLFFILLIILIIDFSIWILDYIGVTDVGYETIEEAVLNEKSIDVDEIAGVLTDGDFSLVICNDKGTYFTEIVKQKDGLYYFFNGINKRIFMRIKHKHFIEVKRISNKYLVIVESFPPDIDKVIISDNISSEFQFTERITLFGDTDRHWFLVLDELPDDYTIFIDDEEIPIVKK